MIRGIAARATEPWAEEAAREALAAGGTAADAAVAGFFAAAGAHAAVLLGPVVALVVGGGAGARAFDGRCSQPGHGIGRPRGFTEDEPIPEAARAAVPRGPAAMVLLHQLHGRAKWVRLAAAGQAAAATRGASHRADLIGALGTAGVTALRRPAVLEPLLAVGGPTAGGLLTEADFEDAAPDDFAAERDPLAERAFVFAGAPVPAGAMAAVAGVCVVVAGDARGQLAALAYDTRPGIAVPSLEVDLGAYAEPVRRGIPRVAPGVTRAAAAPIAVVERGGGVRVALGVAGASRAPSELLEAVGAALVVEEGLRSLPVSGLVAVGAEREGCRALEA